MITPSSTSRPMDLARDTIFSTTFVTGSSHLNTLQRSSPRYYTLKKHIETSESYHPVLEVLPKLSKVEVYALYLLKEAAEQCLVKSFLKLESTSLPTRFKIWVVLGGGYLYILTL